MISNESRFDSICPSILARSDDSRNKTLWALATALFLSLLASLNLYFSSAGALDANVKANTKQIQDLQAVNKALGTEFHEHERRTSVPKAETSRQP
jgi:hypothetical protein